VIPLAAPDEACAPKMSTISSGRRFFHAISPPLPFDHSQ
jgi:hypothetical protein